MPVFLICFCLFSISLSGFLRLPVSLSYLPSLCVFVVRFPQSVSFFVCLSCLPVSVFSSVSLSFPCLWRLRFPVRLSPRLCPSGFLCPSLSLSSVRRCLLVRLSIHPSPHLIPPQTPHTHSALYPLVCYPPTPPLKRKEKRRQASSVL